MTIAPDTFLPAIFQLDSSNVQGLETSQTDPRVVIDSSGVYATNPDGSTSVRLKGVDNTLLNPGLAFPNPDQSGALAGGIRWQKDGDAYVPVRLTGSVKSSLITGVDHGVPFSYTLYAPLMEAVVAGKLGLPNGTNTGHSTPQLHLEVQQPSDARPGEHVWVDLKADSSNGTRSVRVGTAAPGVTSERVLYNETATSDYMQAGTTQNLALFGPFNTGTFTSTPGQVTYTVNAATVPNLAGGMLGMWVTSITGLSGHWLFRIAPSGNAFIVTNDSATQTMSFDYVLLGQRAL